MAVEKLLEKSFNTAIEKIIITTNYASKVRNSCMASSSRPT